jgi:hypothetical protein
MKILYSTLIVLLLLCSLSLVHGQRERAEAPATSTTSGKSKREMVQEEQLSRLLSKVGVTVDESSTTNNHQAYREVTIHWAGSTDVQSDSQAKLSTGGGEQSLANASSVVEDKTRTGTLPRQRSLELSQTQVLIAAVDEKNQLRWWQVVPDPRIVRAETETAAGELRSTDYYFNNLTMVVAFPDDPQIVSLQFYHPSWNGTGFDLKLLAATSVK